MFRQSIAIAALLVAISHTDTADAMAGQSYAQPVPIAEFASRINSPSFHKDWLTEGGQIYELFIDDGAGDWVITVGRPNPLGDTITLCVWAMGKDWIDSTLAMPGEAL